MPEHNQGQMGGTMRLGRRKTIFKKDGVLSKFLSYKFKYILYLLNKNFLIIKEKLYGYVDHVDERHRHRYEANPKYVPEFEKKVMIFVGQSEDGDRMEIMELEDHPYYVGVQYHPEYLSRPTRPSAPYVGFVLASCNKLNSYLNKLNADPTKKPNINTSTGRKYFYLNVYDESTCQINNKIDETA